MISRRTPHNVLGISQQQTSSSSAKLPSTSLSSSILQLNGGNQRQAVNVKLTDDCIQHLHKAAQYGYEVLVHVDLKGITLEIKNNNASSIKFECYFQRVPANTNLALCKSKNAYNDIANIPIRAQVKPTEQTFQSSRQKAANLSRHLELEANKCKTQRIEAPIAKPGEKTFFNKNKTMLNRVGIPKSISYNPQQNGSSSLGSSSSSSNALSSSNSAKLGAPIRGPNALKQQVVHYIASGRFKTQDEIVDHIMSIGLPPGVLPESAKRKIREIICEVAEVYVNPPKIALLPKYYAEINLNWEGYSDEDRNRVQQALAQTEITAGNNFAPMRHSKRGPLVAPRAKRKDPGTPTMTNSTTTSPDLASDASSCSTPSPVNPIQNDDYSMVKPEKRKLSDAFIKPMSSPLNNDIPPLKKRLVGEDTPSSSPTPVVKKEPTLQKSSSQSDFQQAKASPYSKHFVSPQTHSNNFKTSDFHEIHRSKEKSIASTNKPQILNGFIKAKNPDDKHLSTGSMHNANNISKKNHDQLNGIKAHKSSSSSSSQETVKFNERSETPKSKAINDDDKLSEKTKTLMEFADESLKKMKEKEKKKRDKVKGDENQREKEEKKDHKREKVKKTHDDVPMKEIEEKSGVKKQTIEENGKPLHDISGIERKKPKTNKSPTKEKSERDKPKIEEKLPKVASTLKDPNFKEPSKPVKEPKIPKIKEEPRENSKDRYYTHKEIKKEVLDASFSSASNSHKEVKKEVSDISASLSKDRSEKKEKKKDKEKERKREEKEKHRSQKSSESDMPKLEKVTQSPAEVKIKSSTKSHDQSASTSNAVDKPKEKKKEKDGTKVTAQEPPKEKEKSSSSTPGDKLSLKPAEKLSKPVAREPKAPKPTEKVLNPEKMTADEIRKIKIQDLLKMLSDSLKPSKSYEEKYPPIKSQAEAEVYAKHELEYYGLYEKAYNNLLTVQKDLSIYVERLNKAANEQEKKALEEKIRNYAVRCLQDASFSNQRRTVANMTTAIQVLRKRQDDFYGSDEK